MCNLGSSLLYVGIHVRYITHTNIGWIYNGQSLCIPWILFGIIMDPSHTSCSKLAYCWYIFIIQGSKLSTKAVVHIKVGYYWLDNQSDWMVQLGDMMMGPPQRQHSGCCPCRQPQSRSIALHHANSDLAGRNLDQQLVVNGLAVGSRIKSDHSSVVQVQVLESPYRIHVWFRKCIIKDM